MISKSTISSATPDDSVIHRRPYHDMQCNEMQGYDQLTAIVTCVNTLYVSQVNELVLTTTALGYIYTLSDKTLFPNNILVIHSQVVSLFF